MPRKIMVVFGTRPEAIKMCPVVKELKSRVELETIVAVTGQHKEMLEQVLKVFEVKPDFNLNVMQENQTLFDLTNKILRNMESLLVQVEPDLVLVHGDTTTAFATALACYYLKIPIGHVEAGLRTNNLYSPYPEEFNRQGIGLIAKYHFSPTEFAKNNLLSEGKDSKTIFVTGNTVIDALNTTIKDDHQHPLLNWIGENKLILITAHRRENLGLPMRNMFQAIKRVLSEHSNLKAIYPIHMNPLVRKAATEIFTINDPIKIIEPLEVIDFHNFLNKSYIILTDSGGIQEEATSLGKPVLVMRDTTERPEGVEAGTLKLVGTSENEIYSTFSDLLTNSNSYSSMINPSFTYGDGTASKKIVDVIINV